MKKLLYILSLSLSLELGGCYEDKGNYDYDEPYDIKVEGIQEQFDVKALEDSVNIIPRLMPSDAEYDCFWGVYLDHVQGHVPELDTICHEKDLHYKVNLNPGEYVLVFGAREKGTGITKIETRPFLVGTALTTGWYVLRSQQGRTDLDVFTPTNKFENLIATNNEGKNLKGEANTITFLTTYKAWSEENEFYQSTRTLFVLSNQDAVALKIDNGKILHEFDDLFYSAPDVVEPQDCYGNWESIFFMNHGKVHSIWNMGENSGHFGEPKIGDYRISPYKVMDWGNPLLYDEVKSSFCSVDSWGNTLQYFSNDGPEKSAQHPAVNNMGADLMFMGPCLAEEDCNAWALMKKRAENIYLMYKVNASPAPPYDNPIMSCDTLDVNLKILDADRWATNLDNNIIYFARGNKIYSCNISARYDECQEDVLPEGEEITWMKHLKFNPYLQEELWFDYFGVATFDGSNYKIYRYVLQAGHLRDRIKFMEGTGKVGAVLYIKDEAAIASY